MALCHFLAISEITNKHHAPLRPGIKIKQYNYLQNGTLSTKFSAILATRHPGDLRDALATDTGSLGPHAQQGSGVYA
jgi:hypothetical protein